MVDDDERLAAEAEQLGRASLYQPIVGTPELYGSAAFFAAATERLVESTVEDHELGGACYFVRKDRDVVLVGLRCLAQGGAEHVAIDPSWGSVLWHTHPGLRFSLAAFSGPDFEGARRAGRPLLVIGYRSVSPDALGLTYALGVARERDDALTERLLRLGVSARVCWPDGAVRPVRRWRAGGLREIVDDVTFHIDRAVGAAARQLEGPSMRELSGKLRGLLGDARQRARKLRVDED